MIDTVALEDYLNFLLWGAIASIVGAVVIFTMTLILYSRISDAETRIKNILYSRISDAETRVKNMIAQLGEQQMPLDRERIAANKRRQYGSDVK